MWSLGRRPSSTRADHHYGSPGGRAAGAQQPCSYHGRLPHQVVPADVSVVETDSVEVVSKEIIQTTQAITTSVGLISTSSPARETVLQHQRSSPKISLHQKKGPEVQTKVQDELSSCTNLNNKDGDPETRVICSSNFSRKDLSSETGSSSSTSSTSSAGRFLLGNADASNSKKNPTPFPLQNSSRLDIHLLEPAHTNYIYSKNGCASEPLKRVSKRRVDVLVPLVPQHGGAIRNATGGEKVIFSELKTHESRFGRCSVCGGAVVVDPSRATQRHLAGPGSGRGSCVSINTNTVVEDEVLAQSSLVDNQQMISLDSNRSTLQGEEDPLYAEQDDLIVKKPLLSISRQTVLATRFGPFMRQHVAQIMLLTVICCALTSSLARSHGTTYKELYYDRGSTTGVHVDTEGPTGGDQEQYLLSWPSTFHAGEEPSCAQCRDHLLLYGGQDASYRPACGSVQKESLVYKGLAVFSFGFAVVFKEHLARRDLNWLAVRTVDFAVVALSALRVTAAEIVNQTSCFYGNDAFPGRDGENTQYLLLFSIFQFLIMSAKCYCAGTLDAIVDLDQARRLRRVKAFVYAGTSLYLARQIVNARMSEDRWNESLEVDFILVKASPRHQYAGGCTLILVIMAKHTYSALRGLDFASIKAEYSLVEGK